MKHDLGARSTAAFILLVTAAAAIAILLGSCESPAAQREQARAERIRAEAAAAAALLRAQADAASQRADDREAARSASHERVMESLPFIVTICAATGLVALGIFVAWRLSVRDNARAAATLEQQRLLIQLETMRLQQQSSVAELWHAFAKSNRLPSRRYPVVSYDDDQERN